MAAPWGPCKLSRACRWVASANEDISSFELRHRPALKALPSNGPLHSNSQLGSSVPKPLNGSTMSYFSQRDNMANYSGLPNNGLPGNGLSNGGLPSNGFFSTQQHTSYSGLNPLSISGRPSYMQSFSYSGYGGESPRAPNTSAFQPINQMVRNMSTAMPYSSSYGSPYPADPSLERPASDFDVWGLLVWTASSSLTNAMKPWCMTLWETKNTRVGGMTWTFWSFMFLCLCVRQKSS